MEFNLNEKNTIDVFIKALENMTSGILIINKLENEYLQFAGTSELLTVEIREKKANNLIRQYRIGVNPGENIWVSLYTKVGELRMKKSELLDLNNAISILKSYVKGEAIKDQFYKRNISKEIGLIR